MRGQPSRAAKTLRNEAWPFSAVLPDEIMAVVTLLPGRSTRRTNIFLQNNLSTTDGRTREACRSGGEAPGLSAAAYHRKGQRETPRSSSRALPLNALSTRPKVFWPNTFCNRDRYDGNADRVRHIGVRWQKEKENVSGRSLDSATSFCSQEYDEETLTDLPFELFVAIRYLLARRKQAFISLISLISAVGVAVGVMALLIVLALMTGLQGEMRDRIIGSEAHVYVLKAGGLGGADEEVRKVRAVPRVVAAAPVILGLGLAKSAGGSQFITIKGVDPSLEPGVTNVGRSMLSGSLDALIPCTGVDGGHHPWKGPGAEVGRQPG